MATNDRLHLGYLHLT